MPLDTGSVSTGVPAIGSGELVARVCACRLRWSALAVVQQVSPMDPQCGSQAPQHFQGEVLLAALDAGDIGPIDVGAVAQVLL